MIPQSTEAVVVLRPAGKTLVTGLARRYSEEFPAELEGHMSAAEFQAGITRINDAVIDLWPCILCIGIGYAFCLCTCGISFIPTCLCAADTKDLVEEEIRKVNASSQAAIWALRTRLSTSWIEIRLKK